VRTNINKESVVYICNFLNQLLASEFVLYAKTKNYHWNVDGPNSMDLQDLYEKQFLKLDTIIDATAERIRTLGQYADGNLVRFVKNAAIYEETSNANSQHQLSNLIKDYETIIDLIKSQLDSIGQKHGDIGTVDFLLNIIETHERSIRILNSITT
jgi:starvation-inducible DNA-binding protein